MVSTKVYFLITQKIVIFWAIIFFHSACAIHLKTTYYDKDQGQLEPVVKSIGKQESQYAKPFVSIIALPLLPVIIIADLLVHRGIFFFTTNFISTAFSPFEKEGEWKYYYENRQIQRIGSWKNGIKEGQWKYYYENGQLQEIGGWINGRKTGQWSYYYENGHLGGVGNYEANLSEYRNWKKKGQWKYYYENGQLEEIGIYKQGKYIDEWKIYYENGKLKEKGNYRINFFGQNVRHGAWKLYDKHGKLTVKNYL